jgi:hypothetical protein
MEIAIERTNPDIEFSQTNELFFDDENISANIYINPEYIFVDIDGEETEESLKELGKYIDNYLDEMLMEILTDGGYDINEYYDFENNDIGIDFPFNEERFARKFTLTNNL